jgi:hypothetical protein
MERTRHEKLNLQEQQADELEPTRLQERLKEAGIEVQPAVRAREELLNPVPADDSRHFGQRG